MKQQIQKLIKLINDSFSKKITISFENDVLTLKTNGYKDVDKKYLELFIARFIGVFNLQYPVKINHNGLSWLTADAYIAQIDVVNINVDDLILHIDQYNEDKKLNQHSFDSKINEIENEDEKLNEDSSYKEKVENFFKLIYGNKLDVKATIKNLKDPYDENIYNIIEVSINESPQSCKKIIEDFSLRGNFVYNLKPIIKKGTKTEVGIEFKVIGLSSLLAYIDKINNSIQKEATLWKDQVSLNEEKIKKILDSKFNKINFQKEEKHFFTLNLSGEKEVDKFLKNAKDYNILNYVVDNSKFSITFIDKPLVKNRIENFLSQVKITSDIEDSKTESFYSINFKEENSVNTFIDKIKFIDSEFEIKIASCNIKCSPFTQGQNESYLSSEMEKFNATLKKNIEPRKVFEFNFRDDEQVNAFLKQNNKYILEIEKKFGGKLIPNGKDKKVFYLSFATSDHASNFMQGKEKEGESFLKILQKFDGAQTTQAEVFDLVFSNLEQAKAFLQSSQLSNQYQKEIVDFKIMFYTDRSLRRLYNFIRHNNLLEEIETLLNSSLAYRKFYDQGAKRALYEIVQTLVKKGGLGLRCSIEEILEFTVKNLTKTIEDNKIYNADISLFLKRSFMEENLYSINDNLKEKLIEHFKKKKEDIDVIINLFDIISFKDINTFKQFEEDVLKNLIEYSDKKEIIKEFFNNITKKDPLYSVKNNLKTELLKRFNETKKELDSNIKLVNYHSFDKIKNLTQFEKDLEKKLQENTFNSQESEYAITYIYKYLPESIKNAKNLLSLLIIESEETKKRNQKDTNEKIIENVLTKEFNEEGFEILLVQDFAKILYKKENYTLNLVSKGKFKESDYENSDCDVLLWDDEVLGYNEIYYNGKTYTIENVDQFNEIITETRNNKNQLGNILTVTATEFTNLITCNGNGRDKDEDINKMEKQTIYVYLEGSLNEQKVVCSFKDTENLIREIPLESTAEEKKIIDKNYDDNFIKQIKTNIKLNISNLESNKIAQKSIYDITECKPLSTFRLDDIKDVEEENLKKEQLRKLNEPLDNDSDEITNFERNVDKSFIDLNQIDDKYKIQSNDDVKAEISTEDAIDELINENKIYFIEQVEKKLTQAFWKKNFDGKKISSIFDEKNYEGLMKSVVDVIDVLEGDKEYEIEKANSHYFKIYSQLKLFVEKFEPLLENFQKENRDKKKLFNKKEENNNIFINDNINEKNLDKVERTNKKGKVKQFFSVEEDFDSILNNINDGSDKDEDINNLSEIKEVKEVKEEKMMIKVNYQTNKLTFMPNKISNEKKIETKEALNQKFKLQFETLEDEKPGKWWKENGGKISILFEGKDLSDKKVLEKLTETVNEILDEIYYNLKIKMIKNLGLDEKTPSQKEDELFFTKLDDLYQAEENSLMSELKKLNIRKNSKN